MKTEQNKNEKNTFLLYWLFVNDKNMAMTKLGILTFNNLSIVIYATVHDYRVRQPLATIRNIDEKYELSF